MQKTVKKAQKGFTLIELLIVIAVIAILAAIAIPNLLSSRKAANESSAISSIRTIVSAQETYRSRQPTPAYADKLVTLKTANLIDNLLGAADPSSKSGYEFTLTKTTAGYTIVAKPTPADNVKVGDRSFYADETGVIRSAAATADKTAATPDDTSTAIQ